VRKFGAVALTLMGLFIITQALTFMITTASFIFAPFEQFSPSMLMSLAVYVLGVAIVVGLGALLIARRDALAARWFDDSEAAIALDALSLLRVGLIIIGITLVLYSIPQLLGVASVVYAYLTQGASGQFGPMYTSADLVAQAAAALGALVELAAGLVFLARSQPVAEWLWARSQTSSGVRSEDTCPACGEDYDPSDYRDGTTGVCANCGSDLPPRSA